MSKLDKGDMFIIGMFFGILMMLITAAFPSCQTVNTADCTIILKAGDTRITVPCKDSIYYSQFEYQVINKP